MSKPDPHLHRRLLERHQRGVADAVHLVAAQAALVLALGDQQQVVPLQELHAADDAIRLRHK